MEDHEVLGTSPGTSVAQLCKAFVARASFAHPDSGGTDAELRKVTEAFEALLRPAAATKEAAPAAPSAGPTLAPSCSGVFDLRLQRLLLRVHKLLTALPQERRREMLLHRFSEAQRLDLERWMLLQKASQAEALTPPRLLKPKAAKRGLKSSSVQSRSPGVLKVFRQGARYSYYLASVAVGSGIQLQTRTESSLEVALGHQAVLLVIKHRASEGTGPFDYRLKEAIGSVLRELHVAPEAMRLKFILSIYAGWLAMKLRTPAYSVPQQLQDGLQAWRRLNEAQEAVAGYRPYTHDGSPPGVQLQRWAQVRDEYVATMVEAGCSSKAVLDRLELHERDHASRQEEQHRRWNQRRMAEEEASQRRAMKAEVLSRKRGRQALLPKASKAAPAPELAERSLERLLRTWAKSARPPKGPGRGRGRAQPPKRAGHPLSKARRSCSSSSDQARKRGRFELPPPLGETSEPGGGRGAGRAGA